MLFDFVDMELQVIVEWKLQLDWWAEADSRRAVWLLIILTLLFSLHAFFCRWDWHVGASLAVRYLPQWQDWGMMSYCFSPPFSVNLANTGQLVRKVLSERVVQPKWSHKCYSWCGSNSDPRSEAAWRVFLMVFLLCFIRLFLPLYSDLI